VNCDDWTNGRNNVKMMTAARIVRIGSLLRMVENQGVVTTRIENIRHVDSARTNIRELSQRTKLLWASDCADSYSVALLQQCFGPRDLFIYYYFFFCPVPSIFGD
jgi:hypothetical protein